MRRSGSGALPALAGLLLGLPALLVALQILTLVNPETTASTLIGCAVAAIGGVASGAVAERLLRRGRSGREQLAGVIVTSTLGVLTIGYLYLAHIRGPMSGIGSPTRALEQMVIFLEYLSAQVAGMILSASRR